MFEKLNWDLVRKAEETERAAKQARAELSDHILSLSPFQKNDVVRDKDTGCRYRITGGSGYVSGGRPSLLLQGHRVYTTGRREATSSTFLDAHRIEKVEEEVQ